MEHKITTINDAKRIIADWTENYLEPLTDEQVECAARALVEHVGGYGQYLTDDLEDAFDLDKFLGDESGSKRVSLDNGNRKVDAADLTDGEIGQHWDALTHAMDDDVRERVHAELAPCSQRDFLSRYLELASDDLVIG